MALQKQPNILPTYEYDAVVIGGGSGGIAFAKEASQITGGKAKILVLDFVLRPIGREHAIWSGLGGTCVNVGCIPKKLFHRAADIHDIVMNHTTGYGWSVKSSTGGVGTAATMVHDWKSAVKSIADHIHTLTEGYADLLLDKGVNYENALGVFASGEGGQHRIGMVWETEMKRSKNVVTAKNVLIATGCRPDVPRTFVGADRYCVTSDEIFSMTKPPGDTLIVGASYVALECAGFIAGLGFPVTVMIRSIPLRGFDRDCAELVVADLRRRGVHIIEGSEPTLVDEPQKGGKLRVTFGSQSSKTLSSLMFDTVLVAAGRTPVIPAGAVAIGVKLDRVSGKIQTVNDQTTVPWVYAIGDVQHGAPELTPPAIKAGTLLARRLFAGDTVQMNYSLVPTTIYTPLEYGTCGLSEESALQKYGVDGVDVYHSTFKPLELALVKDSPTCYAKVVVSKSNGIVVGMHIVSPNAGEIIQGFSAAMRCGMTKQILDSTIGVHPTTAEEFVGLTVKKGSGESEKKGGC